VSEDHLPVTLPLIQHYRVFLPILMGNIEQKNLYLLPKPKECDSGENSGISRKEITMAVEILDTLGLKCPQPVLKIAVRAPDMKAGDILEVLGDCPTFEKDIRIWCERLGKVFLSVKDEGGDKKAIQIQF
jgi:tRNA 2-thiouridine synthesizing protein A